jgi:small subunit ribosomal protein S4
MLKGCRECRREGEKLFLKSDRCYGQKCAVVKKPYAPGDKGAKGRFRSSDYAKQLREKQKTRRFYQVSEKQFTNYYLKANSHSGNTSEILYQLLETRLDNFVRRCLSSISIVEARQYISHGKFTVNGKKVDIPSYQLRIGDEVSGVIFESDKQKNQTLPKWITIDAKKAVAKVAAMPELGESESQFNLSLIIEYYSK